MKKTLIQALILLAQFINGAIYAFNEDWFMLVLLSVITGNLFYVYDKMK